MNIEKEIENIINKYYHEEDGYYSHLRYDENNKEWFGMEEELVKYFASKSIVNRVQVDQGFDSPEYSCENLSFAYLDPKETDDQRRLHLNTCLLECI